MVAWKKCTSKCAVLVINALAFALAIVIIVFSSIQNYDVHPTGFIQGKSFCQDSVLNDYRPIKVVYTPKVTNGSLIHYKMCTDISSEHKNASVYCIFPTASTSEIPQLYCGFAWDSTAKRIGIAAGQLLLIVLILIWLFKDWKILGFLYALTSLAVLIAYWYLMIIDADSIRKSHEWCTGVYVQTLCNPSSYMSNPQDCYCNMWDYIYITFMDAAGIIFWTISLAITALRLYVSFAHDESEDSRKQYSNLEEDTDEAREKRIQEIRKSNSA